MGDLSVNSNSTNIQAPFSKLMTEQPLSTANELNVTVSDGDKEYTISAEAQYLWEMQIYFNTLDDVGQTQTVEYFAKSSAPLDIKVTDTLRKTQDFIRGMRDGTIKIIHDESESNVSKLLNPNFVMDGTTEIGIRPNGPSIFRLDETNTNNTLLGSESNSALINQLNELEKTQGSLLRNRDAANVFGSVNNVLGYSQNILMSADDVLHFNYVTSQAKKTIEFVAAPTDIKQKLTDLITKSITWQNVQQTNFISNNRKYIGDARVGNLAAEAVRMGSAAQTFNQNLSSTLNTNKISLLDAGAIIKQNLMQLPDLIRFNSNKINAALTYYRNADTEYDKALNRGFYEPEPEWKDPLTEQDKIVFDVSKKYALKVIAEIQGYVANRKSS